MLFFNDFQTILTAAEAYFHLGYAVIPLLGDFDSNRPKVAARSWSAYQQRLATLDEIQSWFSIDGGVGALGIVTGRVSRLAVLDFDSADLFADFRRRFPDLLETRTVTSAGRGLPHLYFHVPSHLHIASQKRQGVDLLSDGRYVVAPPSSINGQAYRITRSGMPRLLTANDIQRLQTFMSSASSSLPPLQSVERGKNQVISGENSLSRSPNPMPINQQNETLTPMSMQWREIEGKDTITESTSRRISPTRADLHGLYLYWRSKYARNEALFRTAIYARDHGWDQMQTRRALTTLHISQSGENTIIETQVIRQREAYATLRSAFSRPARIPASTIARVQGSESIPNSIREALMQRKLTYVLRTLEGLLLSGFRAGRGFTTGQAVHALKGIVGRDSVYNALNATLLGQPFFPQRSPSALPQASNEAANQKQRLKTKKCFFVTEKKAGIQKRGTPKRLFKMPTIKALCALLGVELSGSDPLSKDDLRSAHQTRMALHRELIKRRPGEYSRRWLANRLGVSRRTINSYNRRIPIRTRPTYHERTLSWQTIDCLPVDEALAGAFIETLTGKRYPALYAVGAHLLAKGTFIRMKTRKSNLYWYGSDDPPPTILPNYQSVEPPRRQGFSQERDYENQPYPKMKTETALQNGEKLKEHLGDSVGIQYAVSDTLPEQTCPRSESLAANVLTPLPVSKEKGLTADQQETFAQTIYARVDGLSLKNARTLASTYSQHHIHAALERLQARTNLDNPCGFFVTVLRSTQREYGQ